jgi:hypothetical protein
LYVSDCVTTEVVTVYNFIMSFASGVLFIALAHELWTRYQRTSFVDVWCDPTSYNTKGLIVGLYFVNYVFKVSKQGVTRARLLQTSVLVCLTA